LPNTSLNKEGDTGEHQHITGVYNNNTDDTTGVWNGNILPNTHDTPNLMPNESHTLEQQDTL